MTPEPLDLDSEEIELERNALPAIHAALQIRTIGMAPDAAKLEELGRYLDGNLAPERRAAFEGELAANPELREAAARLHRETQDMLDSHLPETTTDSHLNQEIIPLAFDAKDSSEDVRASEENAEPTEPEELAKKDFQREFRRSQQ